MLTSKKIAIVGSREFRNYDQLKSICDRIFNEDDIVVSGGALGADSMAQRWAKETGHDILICYPNWTHLGKAAGFIRNKRIVQNSDEVHAFYSKGHFQQGGTSNTAKHSRDLNIPLYEYEEE